MNAEDPFPPGISHPHSSGLSPSTLPTCDRGKAAQEGHRQSTHELVEQELGLSDVCQGCQWLGTHEHQVGEEPQEAELHPRPTRERHRSARQLCKGNSSTISSSGGSLNTSLHSRVPEGHGQLLLLTPCMTHLGRVPSAQRLLPRDRWGLSGTWLPSGCA